MDKYIENPETKRLIKIGSRKYKELVNKNILKQETPIDTTIIQTETPEEAKEVQKKINKKSIGKNKVVSRRGNKVIQSNRRVTNAELVESVSNLAIDEVNRNRNLFANPELTDEQMEKQIKRLIHSRLIGAVSEPVIPKQQQKRPPVQNQTKQKKSRFTVHQPVAPVYSEESISEDDESDYSDSE